MTDLGGTLDLARRRHQDGDFLGAEQLFRQVLRADPFNADAAFQMATACLAQGRGKEALVHIDQVLRIRPDFAEAHHTRALAFLAKGAANDALESLRQAVKLKPDYVQAYYNLGVTLAREKKFDEAIAAYRQAIRFEPNFAEALLNLARALEGAGRNTEAISAYERLLRLRPEDAAAHNALGLLLVWERRTNDAVEKFRQAVTLEPGQASYHNNLGAALSELGRPADALGHFEEAVRLQPDHAEAHKSIGMTCLKLGAFERGWAEFEWRWQCKNFSVPAFRQPTWDGSPLEGRRILLYTEQGIGDNIQFVRFASLLAERGALVILSCPPNLAPILKTCPGIAQVCPQGTTLPDFECHAPLMSLPGLLGITLATIPATIPYLSADPDLVERWRRELDTFRAYKVGVVWQGSETTRSFPLASLAPLAAVPGVELFGLQKGKEVEQLADVTGRFRVIDLASRLDLTGGAFAGTAAAMCNLELIVSCDTASAHLAGALGRPVWLPLSYASEWRWLLERQHTPWYPTMRLFRQPELGNWAAVFDGMASALRQLVSEKSPHAE
jgi:tetratricopeptide (TPR) repeat protein